MKNYYEILEVSQSASPEVIEKAYKALVKKYHPDLQPNENKMDAEKKLKIINEAYDILSNKEKKELYDIQLKNFQYKEEQQKIEKLKKEYQNKNFQNNFSKNETVANVNVKKKIKKPHINNTAKNSSKNLYEEEINRAYSNAYNKAYNDAYIQALKNMGYEVKYEKTLKDYFRIFLSIIFLIIFCFILWHIPFIKKFLINIYNSNNIIKTCVDIIKELIFRIITFFKRFFFLINAKGSLVL